MTFELKIPRGLKLKKTQFDALERWNDSLLQRLVISIPTGVGKTLCALVQANSIPGRTLWLAHRDELITQPYEAVQARFMPDMNAGIVKANMDRFAEKLVIASVQTLAQPGRLERILAVGKPDLIVVDEVHHVRAPTYRRVLERCGAMEPRGARVMGLTATAERSDRRSLFPWMEDICYYLSLPKAIELGYLVPMIPILMPLDVDLSKIRVVSDKDGQADFDAKQFDDEFERAQAAEGVAKAVYQHALYDQTVVFSCSVPQAQKTAEELRKLGIKAEAVWGDMPEGRRREVLGALKKREIQAVTNFNLLCLDEETEILTNRGWASIDDMSPGHKVANFVKEDGSVYFEEPKEIVRRPRGDDERMVSLNTLRRSIRVTEGHRMLHRSTGIQDWTKSPAIDIVGKRVQLPVSAVATPVSMTAPQEIRRLSDKERSDMIRGDSWNLRSREGFGFDESKIEAARRIDAKYSLRRKDPPELSVDECRLIGFWVGDGSRERLIRGGMEYRLCQGAAWPNIVKWIDGLLESTGIDSIKKLNACRNAWIWSIPRPRGTGSGSQARSGVYHLEPYLDKNISELLWGLTETQFDGFLHGLWMADGNHGLSGTTWGMPERGSWISTANEAAADRIQALACCRGWRTTTRARPNGHGHTIHILSFGKTDHHSMAGTLQVELVWSPERVWCVKTSSSNLITRRRGTVTMMGNTEGWDDTGVSCVVMARPTLSQLVYVQAIGRGLRLAPELGKVSCKVLDMVDASSLGLVTASSIMKTEDLDEDQSWGSAGGSSDPERDFEIELVRRFLKRARQEPVCVNGTYFVEVKPGELWVTVAKNSQPIYVKRRERGWAVESEGLIKTDTVSQGDAMYAASVGVWEWGGPAVPTSAEWEAFVRLDKEPSAGTV